MRFISNEKKLDFSDVLLVPKMSDMNSRNEVDITRKFIMPHSSQTWEGVPLISANMDTTGTFEMAKNFQKHGMCVALHKHYNIAEVNDFFNVEQPNTFYSMGITSKDLEKLKEIKHSTNINMICIDVANGYTRKFTDIIKTVRDICPDSIIMAGNVVTPERTEQIIESGADIVKLGIGGGSVCTTRIKTSVGYPQLSAVIECSDAAHGIKGLICSDGGCTTPGDIVTAFAGGADFVMLGGMLAGTDESAGEIVHVEGKAFKSFYGMSSKKANEEYAGGLNGYRTAEGKEVLIPSKGPVDNVVLDILGGLRSALTYTGSHKLKELNKRASFVLVNNQINNVFTGSEV